MNDCKEPIRVIALTGTMSIEKGGEYEWHEYSDAHYEAFNLQKPSVAIGVLTGIGETSPTCIGYPRNQLIPTRIANTVEDKDWSTVACGTGRRIVRGLVGLLESDDEAIEAARYHGVKCSGDGVLIEDPLTPKQYSFVGSATGNIGHKDLTMIAIALGVPFDCEFTQGCLSIKTGPCKLTKRPDGKWQAIYSDGLSTHVSCQK